MRVWSVFLLALGSSSVYPLAVVQAESYSLRKECTRDRCVYYRGSTRQFSVEKEYGTTRMVIRDGKRKIVAKIREQADGSVRVEEPYR